MKTGFRPPGLGDGSDSNPGECRTQAAPLARAIANRRCARPAGTYLMNRAPALPVYPVQERFGRLEDVHAHGLGQERLSPVGRSCACPACGRQWRRLHDRDGRAKVRRPTQRNTWLSLAQEPAGSRPWPGTLPASGRAGGRRAARPATPACRQWRLGPLVLVRGWPARASRVWLGVRLPYRGHRLRRRRRWLGIWLRRWRGLGLLARVYLLPWGLCPLLATARADVLVDKVLDHEQRRRPVIKLFALVCADIDAHLAAGRAGAFGLGQLVVPGLAGQVGRQAAATVRPAPPLGLGRRGRLGRGGCRVLARSHLREQQELVGVAALAARPVQAAQQQVDPVPQPLVVTITLMQRGSSDRPARLRRTLSQPIALSGSGQAGGR
jgi:hypothetical protein